jgi:hypothetical protein
MRSHHVTSSKNQQQQKILFASARQINVLIRFLCVFDFLRIFVCSAVIQGRLAAWLASRPVANNNTKDGLKPGFMAHDLLGTSSVHSRCCFPSVKTSSSGSVGSAHQEPLHTHCEAICNNVPCIPQGAGRSRTQNECFAEFHLMRVSARA